jgi:hypothetical protein
VNQGILTQIQQPPAMPYQLLGRATPVPMPAVDYALDVDAADYIRRVEAADGQALELSVRLAIDTFVRGCKNDGFWNALKACCILAGARTLSGALVPLVGAAPTNFNFVAGDYDRKTGLIGNANTKYLDSNRAGNAQAQDNLHMAVYLTKIHGGNSIAGVYLGNGALNTGNSILFRTAVAGVDGEHRVNNRNSTSDSFGSTSPSTGFFGSSRASSVAYDTRTGSSSYSISRVSQTIQTDNFNVFGVTGATPYRCNARLAFYSIGEALSLALLDARVTTLINAISAALS